MPGDTVKMENDQLTINGKSMMNLIWMSSKNFQKISYKENMLSSGFQAQAESSSTFTSDFEYTVPKESILF